MPAGYRVRGQRRHPLAGDIVLSASRVTAGGYVDSAGDYSVADAGITAAGTLTIMSAGDRVAGTDRTPGGGLRFTADTIDHQGVIDNFGGTVILQADSALILDAGSSILADGGLQTYTIADETVSQAYAAGTVVLESQGALEIHGAEEGQDGTVAAALIDVSNHADLMPEEVDAVSWAGWIESGNLDAGQLVIVAPQSDSATDLAGTMLGGAQAAYTDASGRQVQAVGGDLVLTARTIDFSALNPQLTDAVSITMSSCARFQGISRSPPGTGCRPARSGSRPTAAA